MSTQKFAKAIRLIPIGVTVAYPQPTKDELNSYTALASADRLVRTARALPAGRNAAVLASGRMHAAASYR